MIGNKFFTAAKALERSEKEQEFRFQSCSSRTFLPQWSFSIRRLMARDWMCDRLDMEKPSRPSIHKHTGALQDGPKGHDER